MPESRRGTSWPFPLASTACNGVPASACMPREDLFPGMLAWEIYICLSPTCLCQNCQRQTRGLNSNMQRELILRGLSHFENLIQRLVAFTESKSAPGQTKSGTATTILSAVDRWTSRVNLSIHRNRPRGEIFNMFGVRHNIVCGSAVIRRRMR